MHISINTLYMLEKYLAFFLTRVKNIKGKLEFRCCRNDIHYVNCDVNLYGVCI